MNKIWIILWFVILVNVGYCLIYLSTTILGTILGYISGPILLGYLIAMTVMK